MKSQSLSAATLLAALFALPSQAAQIDLFDWGFNLDGTTYCADAASGCDASGQASLPGAINTGGFDFASGLGNLSIRIDGTGAHSVVTFLDHEIDEPVNTFFNEFGNSTGIPQAGQSWEIDEPGFGFLNPAPLPDYTGDIFDNFVDNLLDQQAFYDAIFDETLQENAGVPAGTPVPYDVSLALGWDFTLGANEYAIARFFTATALPNTVPDFYLSHTDPDSTSAPDTLYFWSSLSIQQIPVTGVPVPGSLLLLGAGLVGLMRLRRA